MAKTKKKKRKVKKLNKLKIWSSVFMYLISLAVMIAAILKIVGIKAPYYYDVTPIQNSMILILVILHLIFIIISNVGIKTINAIMFIDSILLAFLVIISFKFLLKGCIMSIVLVLFDLFYLCAIYENSEKS